MEASQLYHFVLLLYVCTRLHVIHSFKPYLCMPSSSSSSKRKKLEDYHDATLLMLLTGCLIRWDGVMMEDFIRTGGQKAFIMVSLKYIGFVTDRRVEMEKEREQVFLLSWWTTRRDNQSIDLSAHLFIEFTVPLWALKWWLLLHTSCLCLPKGISLFSHFFPFPVYYLRKHFLIISDMPEWNFMSTNDFEVFLYKFERHTGKTF